LALPKRVRYIHSAFRRAAKDYDMSRRSTILLAAALCAVAAGAPLAARAAEAEARVAVKRICLPPAETREMVKARRLLEPFAVLKTASAEFKAEALSAKLCHFGDELAYEIALLRRDGRLVHVVMSAASGKLIGARNAREPGLKAESAKPEGGKAEAAKPEGAKSETAKPEAAKP